MNFLYDVSERETLFVLWECECGHKTLERRPGAEVLTGKPGKVPVLSGAK